MANRIKYKTGDIFSIEAAENEYVYGRILFDVKEQYLKNQEKQFSDLDFWGDCVLIETYEGVFPTLEKVDYNKIAVISSFVSKKIFKREDVKILNNRHVIPETVSFPEVISTFGMNYYFSVGEIKIPINISSKERDEINVYPEFGSGYWEMIATLVHSGRADLVEDEKSIRDNISGYFESSDLRARPIIRSKIYTMISEDPNQSYYEMALKHGFDLARFY